ncbi:hypothetical protein F9U64_20780 [Gracilibacillus oryzae]|uniref:LXG domain-containing protein n=1 Tax=Gracilibacillus oryzae TaxID=1672701 RepID=A0A7C8GQP7_9BACI|nr:LXG domain-containing protein [Gracilibacillus oryzae]KAB8126071.1 hypothetical protein F9U64_20780 [Gracilibacillus oryzae]
MGSHQTLETRTLVEAMENRAKEYERLKGQFEVLKNAFQRIVDLEDFTGKGAEAIKDFYKAHVGLINSWLEFIDMQLLFLNDVKAQTEDHRLGGETVVHIPFLEGELENGSDLARDLVEAQQDSLRTIFSQIDDILSLEVYSSSSFKEAMSDADEKRDDTVQNVKDLDTLLLNEYQSTESHEDIVRALMYQLQSATNFNGSVSPMRFDAEVFEQKEIHQSIGEAKELREQYEAYKDSLYKERELARLEEKYNFDQYRESYMHGTWVLVNEDGYADQESLQATEAYKEAVKNGIIVKDEPEPEIDPMVEQTKAAMEGYHYWTGEEISGFYQSSIIFGGIVSIAGGGFSGRGRNSTIKTNKMDLKKARSVTKPKDQVKKIKAKLEDGPLEIEVRGKPIDDGVTYRRVQGGEGTKSSQQRIQVNENGTITIPKKDTDLNISIDNGEHSSYFRNEARNGNADIVEFDVPNWFDEFLKENTIPQSGYKSNPLNQGGTAPKLVDPTKPGNSFEVPTPWIEWIEEYAKNGRILK